MSGELILAVIVLMTALLNYLRTRKVGKRVEHEFTNNGGSSARDLLDQIASEQIRQGDKIDVLHDQVAAHLKDHP